MACINSTRLGSLTCRSLLAPQIRQTQQSRALVVLKRKWSLPLVPMDQPVDSRRMKEKHYIYEVVREDYTSSIPDIDCVLTRHVDGVGSKGQLVKVNRNRFRKHLMPSGSAVYASPENIAEYKNEQLTAADRRTKHALQTYRMLCGMNLPVKMNAFTSWTLTQSHIQLAFRLQGIYVEDLDSITLPEQPITNEQNEKVPFHVKVKVNGIDEATVNCYKVPFTSDPSKIDLVPEPIELPIFLESSEVKERLIAEGLYYGTE